MSGRSFFLNLRCFYNKKTEKIPMDISQCCYYMFQLFLELYTLEEK